MTAHKAFAIGAGIFLISFLAGANAGKCVEVQSVDHKDYDDGIFFNFFVSDIEGYFDPSWKGDSGYEYVTVEHYRDGVSINPSVDIEILNTTSTNPSVGDAIGRKFPYSYTAGVFEKGDYVCFFPGAMMSPIPENSTGVGWSACTYVSGDFVSGLTECKAKCLRESTCNLINFCPEGATCTYSPNYCDLRNCDGDDYKIDGSTYGAGEIYHKVNESCFDAVQNQMEDDVDCGGPNCQICETCTDGIQNQDEEDIDCGGSMCDACLQEETCFDGIQNQDEEDIDCGGSCPPCDGKDMMCKNKLPRRVCNGKWRNGKCKKPWVQARCMATCGHWSKCCGNKMSDLRCNKLKPYCQRSMKIASRCQKTCGKC